jgi:signal peptidase II
VQDEAGAPLIPASPDQRGADDTDGTDRAPAATPATPGTSTDRIPARRRSLTLGLAAIAVVTYVADQVSKAWAVASLTDEPPRSLVGTFLQLDLIRNPGAAFSVGTGSTWVLTLIAVVVLVVIVRTSRRLGSTGWAWALGLLLGGALGNLTDRIVREPGLGQGHVVDFLNYNDVFIGNVADIAIVVGAGIIMVLSFRGTSLAGPVHHAEHADE